MNPAAIGPVGGGRFRARFIPGALTLVVLLAGAVAGAIGHGALPRRIWIGSLVVLGTPIVSRNAWRAKAIFARTFLGDEQAISMIVALVNGSERYDHSSG